MALLKQTPPTIARSNAKSRILLFTLSLFAFSLLFVLFSVTRNSYSDPYPYPYPTPNAKPETSFAASLERFLAQTSQRFRDDTITSLTEDGVVRKFDDVASKIERQRVNEDSYYPLSLPIRVYVYEMPRKFTYDLLWLFRNTYKDTSNLTSNGSPVHRLIEQVFF